ncbi:hypothetical protein WA026_002505 [Henosepilachna vigintioctopunctata]|uniref:Uncharacterized protein n=1 Tax=Henosepilachna vigintioctopunctata TaxID=420089 RepID=A0AAW1TUY1_9CUCU
MGLLLSCLEISNSLLLIFGEKYWQNRNIPNIMEDGAHSMNVHENLNELLIIGEEFPLAGEGDYRPPDAEVLLTSPSREETLATTEERAVGKCRSKRTVWRGNDKNAVTLQRAKSTTDFLEYSGEFLPGKSRYERRSSEV